MTDIGFPVEQGAIILSEDGRATLKAPEEFDFLTAHDFRDAFQETMSRADIKQIVVCLGQTSFMDGSGLRALIEARKEVVVAGKDFSVQNVGRLPRRLLEITDMVEFLNVELASQ